MALQKFFYYIQDRQGNATAGATLQVKNQAGSNATLYEDDGTTPKDNPLTSDSNGLVEAKVEAGTYDFVITNADFSDTIEDVVIANPTATMFEDADGDTKIQVEESSDDDTIRFDAAGSEIADITSAGLRLGGSGARVTTILDEDTMSSDSATAIPTQQSVKAYVDAQSSASPSFRAYVSGAQNMTTTKAKVTFDAETFDTDGDFDSSTNYRHTPQTAGKYLYHCSLQVQSLTDAKSVLLYIRKNGSDVTQFRTHQSGSDMLNISVTDIIDMNGSTDYVEIWAQHTDTGSKAITNDTDTSYVTGVLVG